MSAVREIHHQPSNAVMLRHLRNALARIDELEEQIRQHEELDKSATVFPYEWGLSACQESLLRALLSRDTLSNEACLIAARRSPYAALKLKDVVICHLRRKLREANTGIVIETVWGRGYAVRDRLKVVERFL